MTPLGAVPEAERKGEGWVLRPTCQDCGKQLVFECDTEPNVLARKLARLFLCDECALEDDRRTEAAKASGDFARRLEASGLPKAAKELRWSQMIASGQRAQAIDAAKHWSEQEPKMARGLLLHGPAGTGKSRLAATAAVARMQRWPVRWVSVAMLIAQLQASFSDKDRSAALKVLTGHEPLVLDDLDKVNPSETVRSQLFVAIENRITAEVPLLITTNLPIGKLEERFGEAIVSRIGGYCLGRTFLMDGADRRLQLGEESAA